MKVSFISFALLFILFASPVQSASLAQGQGGMRIDQIPTVALEEPTPVVEQQTVELFTGKVTGQTVLWGGLNLIIIFTVIALYQLYKDEASSE